MRVLGELFGGLVDVQVGNGHLNYIQGHTAKEEDALNFLSKSTHLKTDLRRGLLLVGF